MLEVIRMGEGWAPTLYKFHLRPVDVIQVDHIVSRRENDRNDRGPQRGS